VAEALRFLGGADDGSDGLDGGGGATSDSGDAAGDGELLQGSRILQVEARQSRGGDAAVLELLPTVLADVRRFSSNGAKVQATSAGVGGSVWTASG